MFQLDSGTSRNPPEVIILRQFRSKNIGKVYYFLDKTIPQDSWPPQIYFDPACPPAPQLQCCVVYLPNLYCVEFRGRKYAREQPHGEHAFHQGAPFTLP